MLPSMYMLMYLKVPFVTECLITHITAIWTLHSMYTLMSLQPTYVHEYFMTDITCYIRKLVFFIKFH
jgi:hypothetical protein